MVVPALVLSVTMAASASSAVAQAKAHFEAAENLYRRAQYAEALSEFQTAYRLKPHGVVLFNMGRCYEQLGDVPHALEMYREYLKSMPNAPDRDAVAAAISNLERSDVQAPEKTAKEPATRSTVPSPPIVVEAAPPLASGVSPPFIEAPPTQTQVPAPTAQWRWTWVAGGASVGSLALGIGLGQAAVAARNQMVGQAHTNPTTQQLYNEALGREMAANVAFAVAGTAAVTTVVLFFLEPRLLGNPAPTIAER